MATYDIDNIVVLDQGSRPGPPLGGGQTKVLIIDHHLSDEVRPFLPRQLIESFPRRRRSSLHAIHLPSPPHLYSLSFFSVICIRPSAMRAGVR